MARVASLVPESLSPVARPLVLRASFPAYEEALVVRGAEPGQTDKRFMRPVTAAGAVSETAVKREVRMKKIEVL